MVSHTTSFIHSKLVTKIYFKIKLIGMLVKIFTFRKLRTLKTIQPSTLTVDLSFPDNLLYTHRQFKQIYITDFFKTNMNTAQAAK